MDGDYVDRSLLMVQPQHFKPQDITQKFDMGRTFDLVQCLEVAEHIEPAASDLLVKVRVGADGQLNFTEDANTTRYIDLNDPENPLTTGRNAGKNPQGIVITKDGTRAYVHNDASQNVSVVDLTTDQVIKVIPLRALPEPGSLGEKVAVGAEIFFSSRGNFDPALGTTVSLRDRLSS